MFIRWVLVGGVSGGLPSNGATASISEEKGVSNGATSSILDETGVSNRATASILKLNGVSRAGIGFAASILEDFGFWLPKWRFFGCRPSAFLVADSALS